MPRDRWAELKSRDKGRRARRSNQYETRLSRPVPKFRKQEPQLCGSCNSYQNKIIPQTTRGGQVIARLECGVCGRFLKFVDKRLLPLSITTPKEILKKDKALAYCDSARTASNRFSSRTSSARHETTLGPPGLDMPPQRPKPT